MSDLRKAAEMALEALEDLKEQVTQQDATPEHWDAYYEKQYYALEALRQALEESANSTTNFVEPKALAQPEQEREWVGLTDEEIKSERHKLDPTAGWTYDHFARAIETKSKEKNT